MQFTVGVQLAACLPVHLRRSHIGGQTASGARSCSEWRPWCLALLVLVAFQGSAQEATTYTASIVCDGQPDLILQLTPLSTALAQEPKTVTSAYRLKRRANRDAGKMRDALHALGYLEGEVEAAVDSSAETMTLTLTVVPGPCYSFGAAEFQAVDHSGDSVPLPTAEAMGVIEGAPALSDALRSAEKSLLTALRRRGYPFPKTSQKHYRADPVGKQLVPSITVQAGQKATMGKVTVTGLTDVSPKAVLEELPWQEGADYDERLLSDFRNRLYRRGLFSVVRVFGGDALDDAGGLPISVEVEESKHRTISTGLTFHTTDGPGMTVGWEDRNQRHMGHRLRLRSTLGTQLTEAKVDYDMPHFRRTGQQLSLGFASGMEDTDAYKSTFVRTETWVTRKPRSRLRIGGGLALRYSLLDGEDQRGNEDFMLLSVPFEVEWDGRDVSSNPTTGWRAVGRFEPFVDVAGFQGGFTKLDGTFAWYHALDRDADWVIATRLRLGTLAGESLGNIPNDLRFYGGGGGSIRGYAHQRVGPLDGDDGPTGGMSLVEVGLELRKRLAQNLGLVFFADGGTVEEDVIPNFSRPFQWGVGAGLRYHTPLGPLRFDAAAPLDPRGQDAAFQVYISLGHAF
jgi:translocation and assembly module TamA